MDRDFIHCRGGVTFVEIWIEGRLREIIVGRAAIEEASSDSAGRPTPMSDAECREFVRTNLRRVVTAAAITLREAGPFADSVSLDAGQL